MTSKSLSFNHKHISTPSTQQTDLTSGTPSPSRIHFSSGNLKPFKLTLNLIEDADYNDDLIHNKIKQKQLLGGGER